MVPDAWTQYSLGFSLYQSRYLSNEGRLFFESNDGLVPLDVNKTWDVYQYEPQGVGPAGGCSTASDSGSQVFLPAHAFEAGGVSGEEPAGCVGLISSGTSPEESVFLDASEGGGDVFFLTNSKLTPADFDSSADVYDAHECTTATPCFATPPAPPPPCDTGDSCKPAPSPQPQIFGAPASSTFQGPGNAAPPPPPKGKTAAQIRAEKLTKALKACRKKHSRHKRQACERQARRAYGAKPAAKKRGR